MDRTSLRTTRTKHGNPVLGNGKKMKGSMVAVVLGDQEGRRIATNPRLVKAAKVSVSGGRGWSLQSV